MQNFSRVFFEMNSRDADSARPPVLISIKPRSASGLSYCEIWYPLGRSGVKIIFPGEDRCLMNFAIQGHGRKYGKLNHFAIEHRQRSRQSQAHRTNAGVRRSTEAGRAGTKNLGRREELNVDFQSNDRLIFRKTGNGIVQSGGHPGDYSEGRSTQDLITGNEIFSSEISKYINSSPLLSCTPVR